MLQESAPQLPPHDLDAERALIGSVFFSGESSTFTVIRGMVPAEAFFQQDHAIVWQAIADVVDAGVNRFDAVAVRARLNATGQLTQMGGSHYLVQLVGAMFTDTLASTYAEIVVDCWLARRLIQEAHRTLQWAYNGRGRDSATARAMEIAARAAEIGATGRADDFRPIGDVVLDVLAAAEAGQPPFIPTGFDPLDDVICGFPIGGTTVIGGRPGMGKSEELKFFGGLIAGRGIPVAHITVEESALKVGTNRLSTASGVDSHKIAFSKGLTPEDWVNLHRGAAMLAGQPYFIAEKPVRLSEVEAACTVAKVKYKAQVITVDYLGIIDPETRSAGNRTSDVTLLSNRLKAIFKRLGVAGVFACQLNRNNESEAVPLPPELKHLRESGAIEQDGDVIILLHNEDYYRKKQPDFTPTNKLQMNVAKNKAGRTAIVLARQSHRTQSLSRWTEPSPFEDTPANFDPNTGEALD